MTVKFMELTYHGSGQPVLVNIDDIATIAACSVRDGGGTRLYQRSTSEYLHVRENYADILAWLFFQGCAAQIPAKGTP
jgi:hypothetical protein